MKAIFLSASVPVKDRGTFDETSDPFLIQFAIRELITVCLGRRRLVFGGHPSITPMVHAVCMDLGLRDFDQVQIYQSAEFEGQFPDENRFFTPIVTERMPGGVPESLTVMRRAMLSRPDLEAAIFIGGMEGIFEECHLFKTLQGANARAIALTAPGGAAAELAGRFDVEQWSGLDFARFYYDTLSIDPSQRPDLGPSNEPDDSDDFSPKPGF